MNRATDNSLPSRDLEVEYAPNLKAVRWVLAIAVLAYAGSFFLRAVRQPHTDSGSFPGYFCAVESFGMPWGMITDANLTLPKLGVALATFLAGMINPIFILTLLSKLSVRLQKISTILTWTVAGMMPVCWFVFVIWKLYPVEGYFLWTLAMLAAIFSRPLVRFVQRGLSG
jgi:hypothetical protein